VQLCRWANSARHVASVLREWGEQVFFLELWQQKAGSASGPPENGTCGPDFALPPA
jgi:hypothetical protein